MRHCDQCEVELGQVREELGSLGDNSLLSRCDLERFKVLRLVDRQDLLYHEPGSEAKLGQLFVLLLSFELVETHGKRSRLFRLLPTNGLHLAHLRVQIQLFESEELVGAKLNRVSDPIEWLLELGEVPGHGHSHLGLEHVEVVEIVFEQVHQLWFLDLGIVAEELKHLTLVKVLEVRLRQDRLVCLTVCHSEELDFPNVHSMVLLELLVWLVLETAHDYPFPSLG